MSASRSDLGMPLPIPTSVEPLKLREKNKLRVKDDLVEAVISEIAQNETGLCALEDVIRKAGLSKGTFYNHFPGGRDQLLLLAYEKLGSEFRNNCERLREARDQLPEKIIAFADAHFAICGDPVKGKLYSVAEPALAPILAPATGRASGWVKTSIANDFKGTSNFQGKDGLDRAEACATLIVGAIREAGRTVCLNPGLAPSLRSALLGIVRHLAERDV